MTKIGVFSDIHANPFALAAILSRFEREGCDQLICCGDIVGIGPLPEETAQMLMALDLRVLVEGNHDEFMSLIDGIKQPSAAGMREEEYAQHKWMRSKLSDQTRVFLKSLPKSERLSVEQVSLLVSHYPPEAGHVFNEDIYVHGHTHAYAFQDGNPMVVNLAPVGCPHEHAGIARAGIITVDGMAFSFIPVEEEYELLPVIAALDDLNPPMKDLIKAKFFGC